MSHTIMGDVVIMGLQEKGSRKAKLCEKRVLSKLEEYSVSREFRKFQLLQGILKSEAENLENAKEDFFKDEQSLYKEEVLYDFSALAANKNSVVALV